MVRIIVPKVSCTALTVVGRCGHNRVAKSRCVVSGWVEGLVTPSSVRKAKSEDGENEEMGYCCGGIAAGGKQGYCRCAAAIAFGRWIADMVLRLGRCQQLATRAFGRIVLRA